MASSPRQPKQQSQRGKGPAPEATRRIPAWTGARASPTFSPSNNPPRSTNSPAPQAPHPVPAAANASQDGVLRSLSGLTGTTITLMTKTGVRYEGVVLSTSGEGNTTGVTLKDVKEVNNLSAPLKDTFFIASTNIDTWASGPADAKAPNGDSFRTDIDISKGAPRINRELQAWSDSPMPGTNGAGDDLTFGSGATNGSSWDQFAVNEKLFGVKTNFDEDVYTTKLDRSAADFKERERKAQKIANEIIGSTSNNPHIAEERGHIVDDSGANEEDKYGAVVRGQGAYVPPGARRGNSGTTDGALKPVINAPTDAGSNPATKPTSPGPAAGAPKPPADPLPAFRDFVTNEKQRLTQKRQALQKSEMDKRMAELVKFSQSFKLNKPIPDDLVPILAKDEDKQKAIIEKSSKDAASAQARAIGQTTSVVAINPANTRAPPQPAASNAKLLNAEAQRKAALAAASSKAIAGGAAAPKATPSKQNSQPAAKPAANGKSGIVIQAIPPFKGPKRGLSGSQSNGVSIAANGSAAPGPTASVSNPAMAPSVSAATAAQNRLNVNASSFRPTTKSPSPNLSAASVAPSASVSPKPKDQTLSTPNPFFGNRPIKKNPLHVKDDFNPFKHNKVVEASAVAAVWPYSGKRYMQLFPPPQHQPQQPSPHMAHPGPPPMPPPSYEEDSAAQAASRGYVYAYPPYGYGAPGMMPGMPPPPPGAYMPGPYMQPMHYPPGMGPPNGQPMYGPGMGQMPPPGAYMHPPPPGPYPPPPNSAGRPSMPPTPMQSHAHPYYQQSPQLQHAVPYGMMMPPAPGGPHGYDNGPTPPVPMGGHA